MDKNAKPLQQCEEGQTELAYAKQYRFLASELQYISNLSTINYPIVACRLVHLLHQPRLHLPFFFSTSPRSHS